ncbi:MAG: MobQ family relaxase [Pseudomonadota bacterium]
MASYHLSSQIIGRSKGRSAIKAAAYRAGVRLADHRKNEVYDFSRRRGVVYSEMMLPDGAAEWMRDREKFWNYAERIEKRVDAQLAREINMALPRELNALQRQELLLRFVRDQFVARGMVADVAIHQPVLEKGDHPDNHHAHIMLSMRQATSTGLRPVKTREWNSDELLKAWRESWANYQNEALAVAGHRERVDHRTLKAQRDDALTRGDKLSALTLDREPEIHVGPQASQAARRERRLRSSDRAAGPRRRNSAGRSERRTVRYSQIDKGTRLERNVQIVDANLKRMDRHLLQWQRRAMRFRHKRQFLSREAHAATVRRDIEQRRNAKRRLWQRRRDNAAVIKAMTTPSFTTHRKKRADLIDHLLRDIDVVLAGLLGIQRKHLVRRQHLKRRPPVWARKLAPGRSRARYPIFPSSGAPSNKRP